MVLHHQLRILRLMPQCWQFRLHRLSQQLLSVQQLRLLSLVVWAGAAPGLAELDSAALACVPGLVALVCVPGLTVCGLSGSECLRQGCAMCGTGLIMCCLSHRY